MTRTWLSIRVDLVEGRRDVDQAPDRGRIAARCDGRLVDYPVVRREVVERHPRQSRQPAVSLLADQPEGPRVERSDADRDVVGWLRTPHGSANPTVLHQRPRTVASARDQTRPTSREHRLRASGGSWLTGPRGLRSSRTAPPSAGAAPGSVTVLRSRRKGPPAQPRAAASSPVRP